MNSNGTIRLSKEQQTFLMEMLEMDDIMDAVEKFAVIMADERVDPSEMPEYLKTIIKRMK